MSNLFSPKNDNEDNLNLYIDHIEDFSDCDLDEIDFNDPYFKKVIRTQ